MIMTIFLVIAIIYLLYIWAFLILPFVIALLISFWIISVSSFFRNMWMNTFFSYLFSAFSFFIFFFLVFWIINSNIEEMTSPKKIEFYQNKLDLVTTPLFDYLTKFNIDENALKEKILTNIQFWEIFGTITWVVTSIISNAGLIIIYILFILLEHRFFREKVDLMISNPLKKSKINSIINKIKKDVRWYFFIKTLTSISTGVLSYITLFSFWVDFALFWAFIIFTLNFIPTIGSIIAVSIVSIFAILQFWFNINLFFLISILISIQILIWSIIEPKLMWSRLNLSPLVILLSLWLWWVIWWVIGMLLSVPIMVIINIVLSKFDSTRPISILLSEKWYIDDEDEIDIEKTRQKIYKFLKKKLKK